MRAVSTRLRSLRDLLVVTFAAAFVLSCDDLTKPPTEGGITPIIEVAELAPGLVGRVVAPTSVIVRVTGPTSKDVPLTQGAGTTWTGTIAGLTPGSNYELAVIAANGANQVQYFGRLQNVTVARGKAAQLVLPAAPAVPPVGNPPQGISGNFSQTLAITPFDGATGYTIHVNKSTDPTVSTAGAPADQTVASGTVLVTAPDTGTWYVHTRANFSFGSPFATEGPWQEPRQFTVVADAEGGTMGTAKPVDIGATNVAVATDSSFGRRNLSSAKTEDWYDIPVRAGDTLYVRTWANRLTPFKSPLDTRLTLFRNDGTTQQAQVDLTPLTAGEGGGNERDAEIRAHVVQFTETYRLRVDASTAPVAPSGPRGHYEIKIEVRRVPAAPTALTGTILSPTSASLSWSDGGADNVAQYRIERCDTADPCTWTQVGLQAATDSTFDETALTPNTSYRWRVFALNAAGRSVTPSNVLAGATMVPAAADTLTATTITATRVDLAWVDTISNETGFRVERCELLNCATTGFTSLAGALPVNTNVYIDNTATYGKVYRYRVIAFNNVGDGVPSDTANANTLPPAKPDSLVATTTSATTIALTWKDNSVNETGFRVDRCQGDGCTSFAQVASVPANGTAMAAWTDTTVVFNQSYRYRVRAFHHILSLDFSDTAAAHTRPPKAPGTTFAALQTISSVLVTWADSSSDEIGFQIERCDGNGCSDFAPIDTVPANDTAYLNTGLAPDTYYAWRITALGVAGNTTAAVFDEENTLRPAMPTGLTATTRSATVIRLTWTDESDNEQSFQVDRCAGGGCSNFTPLTTVAANTETWDDSTVTVGASYSYRIVALRGGSGLGFTTPVTANTFVPDAAPSGLTATVVAASQVDLSWTNHATNADSVEIQRADSASGSFALVQRVAAAATSYSDLTTSTGFEYRYRVRAWNAAGTSAASNEAAANTNLAPPPAAIVALAPDATHITVIWTRSASALATGYELYQCIEPTCGGPILIATHVSPTDTTRTIAVAPASDHWFFVRTVSDAGVSDPSAIVNGNTRYPALATDVMATVTPGVIRLDWTDNADNEVGVRVYRCEGVACDPMMGTFTLVLGLDTTTVSIAGLNANSTYTFAVQPINGVGALAPDPGEYVTVSTALADTPSGLTFAITSPTQVNLAWDDNASDETGFVISRCDGAACTTMVPLDTVATDAVSASDLTVTAGTTYRYIVQAMAPFGLSPASDTITVSMTIPAAPTGLQLSLLSSTSVQVDWTDNATNETGFIVWSCDGDGCSDFDTLAVVGPDVETYAATGLAASTMYSFYVTAVNGVGISAPSNVETVGTLVPAAPSDVAASVTAPGTLHVTWSDNATNELSLWLQWCDGQGCTDFADSLELPANTVDYAFVGVADGVTRTVRVYAANASGASAFSPTVSITTGPPLTAPVVTAPTTGYPQITLSWTDFNDNEDTYRVVRCTGAACDPTADSSFSVTLPRNTTAYVDNGLATEAEYRYIVRAMNGAGEASSSATYGHTVLPSAPTGLNATTISNTQIDLGWTDNSPYETAVVIERCTGAACASFAPIDTVGANVVAYSDTSLTPNTTYRYRVLAMNGAGASGYSNVAERATNLPATPTALAAVAMSAASVRLTWADNASNETAYLVYRCAGACGAGDAFSEITGGGLDPNTVEYTDATAAAGATYTYRVRALNAGGFSPYSNLVTVATLAPTAPSNLTVTTLDGTHIRLIWDDNADNELSYRIERCTSATCPTFSEHKILPPNDTIYVDTVAVDAQYTYRVRAVNNVGASAYTSEAFTDTYRPAAPTNFEAVTVSGTRIDISWTDNATNEAGFLLERCTGVGCTTWVLLDTLAADATYYENSGLPAQTYFSYRLTAFNISGHSATVGPDSATTITPATPTGLTASLQPGSILLEWVDNADNEHEYRVERCVDVGCAVDSLNFVQIAALGANATGYVDGTIAATTSYSYRVRAINTSGASAYTNVATRQTSIPPAPTGLSAVTVTANRVDMGWTHSSTAEDGFTVERCIGAAPCTTFDVVGTLPANTTSFADSTVSYGQVLWYRVRAFNGGGSAVSVVDSANTFTPNAPTALAAVADGMTAIDLSWTDNASNEVQFLIERCTGDGCTAYVEIDDVLANTTTYTDATVTAGNVYQYRVRAYGNGRSAYTNVAVTATIVPDQVTGVTATAVSASRIDLAWTDNTPGTAPHNESAFVIERCAGAACASFDSLTQVGAGITSYVNATGLVQGESYTYRVVAVNGAGAAAASDAATAATNVPEVPTFLRDSTTGFSDITLLWTDNANNETGYEIEQCAGAGCSDFVVVDTAAVNATSIVVTVADTAVLYRFRIRAFNASGASGYSNEVVGQSGYPRLPSDEAGVVLSPSEVRLTWTDHAVNETGHLISRCTGVGCSSSELVLIAEIGPDLTEYVDATVSVDETYGYRVTPSNATGGRTSPEDIFYVSTHRPDTPTDLTATAVSATQVNLTWTDVATNDTAIVVERASGADGFTSYTTVATLSPTATAYSDVSAVVNTTYAYRISAVNPAGASAPTDTAMAATFIPSDPSTLEATTVSDTVIALVWSDNSNTEEEFVIERCVGDGCSSFDTLAVVPAGPGVGPLTYDDSTVTLSNNYSYRVTARASAGTSGASNIATANTYLPTDVTGLEWSPVNATILDLAWKEAGRAHGYIITRTPLSTGVTDRVDTLDTGSALTTLRDTVVTGDTYTYTVQAYNAAGTSAVAMVDAVMTPPPAPATLSAVPLTLANVALSWAASPRAEYYEIQRCFGAVCTPSIAIASTATTTYNDTEGLAAGSSYRYHIIAVNAIGESVPSPIALVPLTGPVAPSGLTAAVTSPGKITLNWTDNANNELSFAIERSVNDALNFSQIATVGANSVSHVDSSGLSINTSYFYRIRAVNNLGQSAYSGTASATTTVPVAVASLNATTLSASSIQVNWADMATTELGYRVYRCTGGACSDFALLDGSLPSNSLTYTDNSAVYGNTYRYQVRPYNLAGEPANNPIYTHLLELTAPWEVNLMPEDRTTMRVQWSQGNLAWATGYEVESCQGLNCTDFAPVASAPATDSVYLVGGLVANGALYRVRVRAIADGNAGPFTVSYNSNTPIELTVGSQLRSVSTDQNSATANMTHYVVTIPAGSPSATIGLVRDPLGSTSWPLVGAVGSYLSVVRGHGPQRPAWYYLGITNDSLCTANGTWYEGGDVGLNCTIPQPGVDTDFYVTTYSYPYNNLQLTALPTSTYTFNNCTQVGRVGPSQVQCDGAYAGTLLAGKVAVADSGFQDFTVPFSGRWQVVAVGARGASSDPDGNLGGRGAQIVGEFNFSAGTELRMAVGQMGLGQSVGNNGGGGGGSFVFNVTTASPILIAGGGGGTRTVVDRDGCDASITVFGTIASGAALTTTCDVKATDAGLGGIRSASTWGSAGAGFNSNGQDDLANGGGRSWANYLVGGVDGSFVGHGGFGGGGSGYGGYGGGGGGGYSGGDGGRVAGGGGSLNTGTNQSATVGVGTSHGYIILRYLGVN